MRGKRLDGFVAREQALADFFAAWTPGERVELVPLSEAVWRISAQALTAVNTLPVYRSSGCDGIAVESSRFACGVPDYAGWRMGEEFVRADTGDDFEDRYDAVIPIEEVDLTSDGRIAFISPDIAVTSGCNVQPRGSLCMTEDPLIGKNLPIRPTDLASLAMGGVRMVPVRKKPRIAFIPTGSELIPHTARPRRGQNIDANTLLVTEMLKCMGAEPVAFPIVPDAPAELEMVLEQALEQADAVIVNGGTAKGGEDFNTHLLEQKGRLIHHYIAAAPGRPMALAVVDDKPVINLPGPAMAAFFGMTWCVQAVVCRYLHIPMPQRPIVTGLLMEDIHSTPHMDILCRMNAVKTAEGYELYPLSFHTLRLPLCMAGNAMYVCPVGESYVPKGSLITAELLRGEEYLEER